MRTNEPTTRHGLQRIAHVPAIGTDETGATHHFASAEQTVYVVADGEIGHVERLDGRPLTDWTAFVAERRGWTDAPDLRSLGLGAWLCETVEAAR